MAHTECVLFDFDGPICRLLAGNTAEAIAKGLVARLDERGMPHLLTEEERQLADPQAVLLALGSRHPESDLVAEGEEHLTQQELKAAGSAWPTAHADNLIRTLAASGIRLAITTNNSARAVRAYLTSRGLVDCFAPHIYGRTAELRLLKPDPHCLHRALNALGCAPSAALMVGAAEADLRAARAAGVPFLGHARHDRQEKALRDAGAERVVTSLEPVRQAVWDLNRPRLSADVL